MKMLFSLVRGLVHFVLFAAALLILIYVFRRPLVGGLGKWLITSEPPQKSELIVVITGTDLPERARYAAKLYKEHYAPKVLISGHMVLQHETGIDLMKGFMIQLGVPEDAILREPESRTTTENALFSRDIVIQKKIHSIVLVTSPLHTRRAFYLFRRAMPENVRVTVSANTEEFQKENWWQDPVYLRDVAYEFLNLLWLQTGEKSFESQPHPTLTTSIRIGQNRTP